MAREQLCELQYEQAVDIVKEYDTVLFRHGVWNKYEYMPSAKAIERIRKSGYGADVFRDNDQIYVSCPVSSDMW